MNRVSMVLACAAMLFAVQPAASEDVSSELAEMRELVQGLKQKVDAQEEQLEHQGQLLEQAQAVARQQQEEEAQSGLAAFLDSIAITGHIAASYNYNTKVPHNRVQPDNGPFDDILGGYGVNAGEEGFFLPFHQDHNTITVDQIALRIGKEATEESRAGFGFGVLLGSNASVLGQGALKNNNGDTQSRRAYNLDGTSDYYITEAYIEYMCGCLGPEIDFTLGKFMTLVGAEVFQSPANYNITRGIVYGIQPVDHTGILASTDIGPVNFTAGVVNSATSLLSQPDNNNEKSYLGSLYVGDDRLNVRTSFLYGAEGDLNGNMLDSARSGLVDVTTFFNPTESLSFWANYDYLYLEDSAFRIHAIAVAGRAQLTEKIGAATRFEYLRQVATTTGGDKLVEFAGNSFGDEVYSVTLTGDYRVTDHLLTRLEGRWDYIKNRRSGVGFFESNDGFDDNQLVLLAEAVYEF